MSTIPTNVPIDSQGHCPDPDLIRSEVRALDLIVYELVPAMPGDDISAWEFVLFLTSKQGGGLLPLTLALPGGQHLSALVLPALAVGSYNVNLKIRNTGTGETIVIDPVIIRK